MMAAVARTAMAITTKIISTTRTVTEAMAIAITSTIKLWTLQM